MEVLDRRREGTVLVVVALDREDLRAVVCLRGLDNHLVEEVAAGEEEVGFAPARRPMQFVNVRQNQDSHGMFL